MGTCEEIAQEEHTTYSYKHSSRLMLVYVCEAQAIGMLLDQPGIALLLLLRRVFKLSELLRS